MYNNVYQEYINNMIGGTPRSQPVFGNFAMPNTNQYSNFQSQNNTNVDLERCYPELYKLLYPMVKTACMRNTKPITEETINEMTRDIYSNFNADNVTVLNINLTNDVRSSGKVNPGSKTSNGKATSKVVTETRNESKIEERNIRPNNYVLNDLIRILLIRELLGRPGNMPPVRQEFPGQGPGKSPFRTRDISFYNQNYDIYEHFDF